MEFHSAIIEIQVEKDMEFHSAIIEIQVEKVKKRYKQKKDCNL